MGLLGRLTGWDQQKDAHNAVVGSHLADTAHADAKRRIAERIVEIQRQVKGRYAGSLDDILRDLDSQPRSVQMNFVALACNSLGIQPNVHGLYFNEVQNPYLAKGEATTERIDFVVRYVNARYPVQVGWPGNDRRVSFSAWLKS